jgi:methionine-gamma-lyase
MAELGIVPVPFANGLDVEAIRAAAAGAGRRVGAMLVETPGNPTNSLVDIGAVRVVADEIGAQQGGAPPVIVDNTFLGPVYQKPLALGADVVVYSLTKYAGGHSDLTAGGACGAAEPMRRIMQTRGALGTQLDPHTCWMLLRSLETLEIRCARAVDNARRVATFLAAHPKIERVHYLGFPGDPAEQAVYARQCTSPGSTFSFEVRGGEPAAFAMLDALRVIKLAVSLGGTETLISHPASTTHSGVAPDQRAASGVTESLVRISIGIESADDLIADLAAALAG